MKLFRPPYFSKQWHRVSFGAQWVIVVLLVGVSLYTMVSPQTADDERKGNGTSTNGSGKQMIFAETKEHWETFPFDPNTADSTQLLRLGLAPWQVRSVYRFRAKHGRYHAPEDFMRTPGMTNELWDRLRPFIRIDKKYQLVSVPPRQSAPRLATSATALVASEGASLSDSGGVAHSGKQEKFAKGTKVDVNTADTATLKRIPGIGSYRATKIVEYRKALGGYARLEQVMEACEQPDGVLDWLVLSAPEVKRIDINRASVQQMMRHPYISFYMARDINEYRRLKGPITDEQTLLQLPTFNEQVMERLRDYIEYE